MTNPKPLEIEPLVDCDTLYAKGHIDPGEFVAEAAMHYTDWTKEECKVAEKHVVHCLGRIVPVRDQATWGCDYHVYFNQEKKRGAFPMTYIDPWRMER